MRWLYMYTHAVIVMLTPTNRVMSTIMIRESMLPPCEVRKVRPRSPVLEQGYAHSRRKSPGGRRARPGGLAKQDS